MSPTESQTIVQAEADEILSRKARSMWLSPTSEADLEQVEAILKKMWYDRDAIGEDPMPEKKARRQVDACSTKGQAGTRLAFWLIQSNRVSEGDEILRSLSFECRLSSRILMGKRMSQQKGTNNSFVDLPCRVYDRFLSPSDVEQLWSVFGDVESSYWTDHNYSVEPPSPYFSYLLPLKGLDNFGFLGSLIARLRDCLQDWQPLLKTCSHCEMWAHNRPSATGHQLHFDTDNEGRDSNVRHPVATAIVYLTDAGGPTLITNQRKTSRYPADKGWLCNPVVGRITALDGRVLHCVVPGQPVTDSKRRVTVMLAFWRRIKVRDETSPGAARRFPDEPPWAQILKGSSISSQVPSWDRSKDCVDPEPLDHVFETLRGEPWSATAGLPSYDCVFQGI
jgi:hypothetical protein